MHCLRALGSQCPCGHGRCIVCVRSAPVHAGIQVGAEKFSEHSGMRACIAVDLESGTWVFYAFILSFHQIACMQFPQISDKGLKCCITSDKQCSTGL